MVVTYYIKLYGTRADRNNGILMSLLLLVADTKKRRRNRKQKMRESSEFIRAKQKSFGEPES